MEFPEQIESERIILKRPYPTTFQLAQELYDVVDKSRDTLREWLPWVDLTHSAEAEYTNYLIDWCQKHWESEKGYAYVAGGNVYFDTSSTLWKLPVEKANEMIKKHGYKKFLFGSDYPMWDHEDEFERFALYKKLGYDIVSVSAEFSTTFSSHEVKHGVKVCL